MRPSPDGRGNSLGGYDYVATSSLNFQANLANVTGTLGVANGGTGQTSFAQGWLGINDSGAFISSTSPTVNYIIATSTATSTFAGSLAVTEANATSTFAGGIDLSDGCFAIDGVCLGGSSYGDTNVNAYIHASSTIPKMYTANTFTALQQFSNASSTLLSTSYASSTAWYGGGLLSDCTGTSNKLTWNLGTFRCEADQTGGGGGGVGWATTTGNNESIYFYGTSNVGIGTTSPYARLSVVGQIVGEYFTATSTTATSTFAGGLNVGQGNFMYDLDSGVTSASSFQTGNLNFDTDAGLVSWADLPLSSAAAGTAQGYTAYLNGSSTISVYGVSAGSGWLQGSYPRVSIGETSLGTSTPTSRLTVFGSGTGTGGLFELVNSASTTLMKVLDNGNIGIGTTSPWRTLSATGTVAFAGLTALSGSSGSALCLSSSFEVIVNNGAQTCTVSSARFKDNITTLSSGLDTVMKLNPVSYVYKGSTATASSTDGHLGLVAEEVYAVEPRLVFLGSDGLPRGVRYEEVTSVLTKAIQEQQGQIGSIASTTLVLDSQNKQLSDLLVTNLASSSQSNKDLAKALDLTNSSIISLGSQIDLLTAGAASTSDSLSVLTASVGDLDGRVQSLELLLGNISATSTFITQIASSTALVLASSTADILASSTPFLSRVFDGFMEFLTTATTRVKGIFVQELHVEDKLCVDDVCINKDQLKALLVQAGGTNASSTPAVVPPAASTPVVSPESTPAPTPAPVVEPTPSATPASSTPQVTEPTSDSSASSTPATGGGGSAPEPAPESTPSTPAPESQPAETPAPTDPGTVAESAPAPEAAPAPAPAPEPAPAPAPAASESTGGESSSS